MSGVDGDSEQKNRQGDRVNACHPGDHEDLQAPGLPGSGRMSMVGEGDQTAIGLADQFGDIRDSAHHQAILFGQISGARHDPIDQADLRMGECRWRWAHLVISPATVMPRRKAASE